MKAVLTGQAAPYLPALSENRAARFAAVMVLYFLQGVPIGLSTVAIPAWLAANGATPLQVGAFVGTAVLPWSLKPFSGLVMDRFAYKPMGRRRGWILGAQAMMLGALFAVALMEPGVTNLALLAALCFTLNLAATLNDVAIDGMAVDIVPDDERTAVNSCMFASQVAGVSVTSFIAAAIMDESGLATLALALAGIVAAASLFVSLFRERPGERLLPWSQGQASHECMERQFDAWLPIFKGMLRAVVKSTTLIFLLANACAQATFAFTDAVAPTLSVQQLGWASADYSNFAGLVTLISAGAGLTLPMLMVRFLGLRPTILGMSLTLAGLAVTGGLTFESWGSSTPFMALYTLQFSLAVVLTISTIVWAMRICDPAVAASLFALFMAVPNFGRSMLSGWSGTVIEAGGYSAAYFAVAGLSLAAFALFLIARIGDERLAVAGAEQ